MTEPLHNYLDYELSSKLDSKMEEEADKLNDFTFNSELPWEYDELDLESDDFFQMHEFDKTNLENEETIIEKVSDDLLGLTGSLINVGIFKTNQEKAIKHKLGENLDNKNIKHDDFELAFKKLDVADPSAKYDCESSSNQIPPGPEDPLGSVIMETPFNKLSQFSEMLYCQFQQYQKQPDTNLHMLNQIVSNHLNLLSKQLQLLQLSIDILPQLRYFRILMGFVAIDNRLTEIQTRYASNPTQLNMEIGEIIRHFFMQPLEQQIELSGIHPFYSGLMAMLSRSGQADTRTSLGSPLGSGSLPEWVSVSDEHWMDSIKQPIYSREDSHWMTESERDWLIKIQTKNLITDNPYVHDYYFTKMKLKQLSEARKRQIIEMGHTTISDPLSLLPSPITGEHLGAGIDPSHDGIIKPGSAIHFEKSLGVLSPSNLNAPRQAIQLCPVVSPPRTLPLPTTVQNVTRQIRSHRDLLALIEKIYSIVLRVDEVDKSLARMLVEQHKSRGVLIQHRNFLLKLLMDCMMVSNSNSDTLSSKSADNVSSTRFVELLSVSKGAHVVVTSIAIVTPAQFLQLLRIVFYNCSAVCESEFFSEVRDELKMIICSRMRSLTKEELSELIKMFFSNVTTSSINSDNNRSKPFFMFCNIEFGLYIVLTLLDSFLRSNPTDKAHVTQLLSITIKSTELQSQFSRYMTDFKYLFPTMDRH